MDITEKLKLLQDLLGYKQQELANYLGVSFPTVNSWLRKRSIPHSKTSERIDHILSKLTGNSSLQSAEATRLTYIESHRGKLGNILDILTSNPDIADAVTLSLTYNTNRIEGSTLSEKETQSILFNHATLPNKTLVEQMEAINHKAAWNFLIQYLQNSGLINIEIIVKLHSILMNGIRDDAGFFRQHPVRIVGAKTVTANYLKIPALMDELIAYINLTEATVIESISQTHSRFEQIHPFSDGNGRVGRLLMQAMLIKTNYPIAIIRQEKKQKYYDVLERAQTKEDFIPLQHFLVDAMTYGIRLLSRS
jgi:Fic family protein